MAGQPVKGLQPARTFKPSRLRNEIRDSTDDETLDGDSVQVPNSDIIVQETQFDSVPDYGTDDEYDEAAIAMIERNTASRTTKPAPASPLQVKMLTREALGGGSSQPSSPAPTFAFGQAKKMTDRTHFKAAQPATTHVAMPIGVEQARGQSRNVVSGSDAPKARLCPEPAEHVKTEPPMLASKSHTNALPSLFQPTNACHLESNTTGLVFPGSSLSIPTSAQPRPIDVTKKIRIVKSNLSGKKFTTSQRRTHIRPPQSSLKAGGNGHSPMNDLTMPHTFGSFPEPPPAKRDTVEGCPNSEKDVKQAPTTRSHTHDEHDSEVDIPQVPIGKKSQQDKDTIPTVQCITHMGISKVEGDSSQATAPPQQSSAITVDQAPDAVPEHASQAILEASSAMHPQCVSRGSLTQGSIESPQKASHDFSLAIYDIPTEKPVAEEGPVQIVEDSDAVHATVPRRKEDERIRHKTFKQDNLHRVSKPRKMIRASVGSAIHRKPSPSTSLGIDLLLDQIRLKCHANDIRVQHEKDEAAKHHEGTTAALRELVNVQYNNIAEWKEKHHDLRDSLTRLMDRAKTNQKYATGLQNDYEKLQKSAIAHHVETKKTLREKIAEVEQEKESLQKDFASTLTVLENSQRNLKATATDLFMRLELSHSKQRSLVVTLNKQTALYEAECRKREDLEKHLFESVQSMQRQLGKTSTALFDKLKNVQSSLDEVNAPDSLDPRIEECLKILQNLQAMPFLTSKDVTKAEGMLRFVHEQLNFGVNDLKSKIVDKHLPLDELQTFIKSQLSTLRADQLKHDDLVSKYLEADEANESLRTQLVAQEKNSRDLENSIEEFRKNDSDLKARLIQLESALNEVKGASHDHGAQPSEPEQRTSDLRQRAEKAEGCLAAAQDKTETADRLRHQTENEVAKYKRMYSACREKLLETAKQKQKVADSFNEMRSNIIKDYQTEVDEKENGFKNEIHRISVQRDECEMKLQEQLQQAKAAKNHLHDVRNNVKALTSEIQTVRGEKDELQTKLKVAQQNAESSLRGVSELASVEKRLQQKIEEVRAVNQDHTSLKREHADLKNRIAGLQSAYDQSQAQTAQQFSTIETLREDTAKQLLEAQKNAQNALHAAQDQASALRKDRETLVCELEQARSTEAKLEEAKSNISQERDTLKQHLAKLRVAKDSQDAELARNQADVAESKRVLMEVHRKEVEDLTRRLNEASAALKNAEAQNRRMEDEHRAKLASDKKSTASMFQLIRIESEEVQHKESPKDAQSGQRTPHFPSSLGTSTHSLQNVFTGNNKKKVNRQNQSVLSAAGSLSTQFDTARHLPNGSQHEPSHTQRQDSELSTNLFEEGRRNEFASEDLIDSHDLSLVDAATETVPETQLTTRPAINLADFDDIPSRVASKKTESRDGSSTDLSIMGSEDLMCLELSAQTTFTPMLSGRDLSSPNITSDHKNRRKTRMQNDDMSIFDLRSSQPPDRPKSQANTASRMMPPPESPRNHPRQHYPSVKNHVNNSAARHASHEKSSRKLGGNANSGEDNSPDFMHSEHTHHDRRLYTREHSHMTSRSLEQEYAQKRKASINSIESDSASKKQRTSSGNYPSNIVSGSRQETSKPFELSALGSHPRAKPDSAHPAGAVSVKLRSTTQHSSSNSQNHRSSQGFLSSDIPRSRARTSSSPRSQVVDRARHSSVRPAKGRKSRGGNDVYDNRFGQELSRR